MPLTRLCVPCSLPCRATSASPPSTFSCTFPTTHKKAVAPRARLQQRVLTYYVGLNNASEEQRTRPRLRSPHNWAHIVHHSRHPATLSSTQSNMAAGIQASAPSQQVRTHMGHSHHGHHHHHDNTYLTSQNKDDPGVRITRVGLYVNLGMAIAKGAGGYVFNSQA